MTFTVQIPFDRLIFSLADSHSAKSFFSVSSLVHVDTLIVMVQSPFSTSSLVRLTITVQSPFDRLIFSQADSHSAKSLFSVSSLVHGDTLIVTVQSPFGHLIFS